MKPFTSYLSAGLFATAIAFALFAQLGWPAFSLLGLICGIATRNFRRCITGLATSAGIGLLICCPLPVYTDLTSPYFGMTEMAAILGASIGSALQLPHRRLTITAAIGCIASQVILVILSSVLSHIFPQELRVLEKPDYITMILAVPIIGLGT